jgi:hypothetical protein
MQDKDSLKNNITPSHFYLSQNYPNPFDKCTSIKYCIGSPCRVKLTVYNGAGEEIKILVDEEKNPGTYEVVFNVAQDSSPVKVNTTYYYRLEAGDYKCEKEMEIIK